MISSSPFVIADPASKKAYSTSTFHVSRRSCELADPSQNYEGIVLWAFKGKSEWILNGVKCRTGFIYLKDSRSLGKLYKSLFTQDYSDDLFATGFALFEGKWTFNSPLNPLKTPRRNISLRQAYAIFKSIMHWACTKDKNVEIGTSLNGIIRKLEKAPLNIHMFLRHRSLEPLFEQLVDAGDVSPACRLAAMFELHREYDRSLVQETEEESD